MVDQNQKAQTFADLHIKGEPVILYNAWDGGSARAISSCGAKAMACGDHPVGYAHGYDNDDFDDYSFDSYLISIKEIIARVGDLPFSVDISNGAGLSLEQLQERVKTLLDAGVVGINFEDRLPDSSGVLSTEEQVGKLQAIRATADAAGVNLFINARSELFALNDKAKHAELLDEVVERSRAYKAAGANGFFTPFLMDINLISQLCEAVELPVNIIKLPGTPSTKELAAAGVARISYGPVPQMQMIEWLKEQATKALQGEI